ncbi:MAG: hypothetical protein K8T10_16210 [Candidatus Eremiobacteraeota bacterium]|nr:hypothetical protein [Candidatus Eremiobacteraeota bacterium]
MATITQRAARVANTISGNSPEVKVFPEAASQSFKAGEFVYLVSGKVTVCASNGTVILGMAVADASGTTDEDCAVYIANGDTVFEANIYHSTVGSAVTAITDVGVCYALLVSSNKHYVDKEDTDNDAFQVRRISPKDIVGDTYGRVEFQVIASVRQLGDGS